MQLQNYWSGFREELVATSLVLVVAMGGSFFIADRLLNPKSAPKIAKTGLETESVPAVLGEVATEAPVESRLQSLPTSTASSPTPNSYLTSVPFGSGGIYDENEYTVEFINPRLEFDARTNLSRKFLVDITLTNKTVAQGLYPKFTASIVKDGTVIVPAAALSANVTSLILPGLKTTITARLSLIEGTDIQEISSLLGEGFRATIHALNP